jgi:hydroxyethylthiazole kinase
MTFPKNRLESAWNALQKRRPLVYNMTNGVAMAEQAHVLLAAGASPVMSLCAEEVESFARIADATLLNIGTPSASSGELFGRAARAAKESGRPVVLDPVGFGATDFRNRLVRSLFDTRGITVVKGNASEISLLAGQPGSVRGVDRGLSPDPAGAVLEVARREKVIAAATGRIDWVSDGVHVWSVEGGDAMLERLSGSGCWLGSLIAACIGASGDPVGGTLAALCAFDSAAEAAASVSRGPGSFRIHFLDALHDLGRGSSFLGAERIREATP